MINNEADDIIFMPVSEDKMPLIWTYLKKTTERTTDFSYGGILMWVEYFRYEYAIYEDTLFIKGRLENDVTSPAFALPVGKLSLRDSINVLRKYCDDHEMPLRLSAVPQDAIEEFKNTYPNCVITPLLDWGDYLYDADMLSTLTGKKMNKKRNHVNKFHSLYPDWHLQDISIENLDETIKFMDAFEHEADLNSMATLERKLTKKMLHYCCSDIHPMFGVALYVKDKIVAISIGDVKQDTFFVHVEKALREYDGSYELINKEFASKILKNNPQIKYINREDDSGDIGLRIAKESYHPIEILEKYNILIP